MSFIGPASLSLFGHDTWAYVLGLCARYFNPNQLPPQPLAKADVGMGCTVS